MRPHTNISQCLICLLPNVEPHLHAAILLGSEECSHSAFLAGSILRGGGAPAGRHHWICLLHNNYIFGGKIMLSRITCHCKSFIVFSFTIRSNLIIVVCWVSKAVVYTNSVISDKNGISTIEYYHQLGYGTE